MYVGDEMFTIMYNGERKTFDQPIRLQELLLEENKECIVCKVNNTLRELDYVVDRDSTVEFLTTKDSKATKVYEAGLRFLITMAVYKYFDEEAEVYFDYSISRSIKCEIKSKKFNVDTKFLKELDNKIQELVNKKLPIKRITVSKEEAIQIYEKFHFYDKIKTLKYRKEEKVHLYECDGFYNYMYTLMVNNTSLINTYRFRLYTPGFIIQYPRADFNGEIPEFIDDVKFGRALKEEKNWINICNAQTIADLNDYIRNKNLTDLVNMCETRHNDSLCELGNIIKSNIDDIRLICVAGPSSSGKTTFTNRLRVELMSKGIKPYLISIDDFYLTKDQAPKDENGNPDLEHIEALDIELFNESLAQLINGEEVALPEYNFMIGKRLFKKPIKLAQNTVILIEGIHALNERLTSSIPKHQKFKIYIAPQTQYHIDNHNPISLTDIRLLRRIVRDKQFRNTSPEQTLDMWPSVRNGEFKWIYPNQDNSDYVYNSELTYELGVMKKYALESLSNISRDSKHFITANRLVKFLKYFDDINDKYVPVNSVLREFIGGSSFYFEKE